MRRATILGGLLVIALGSGVGCALAPTNLAAGARCVRSTQCAPGLVCGGGVCTTDLDGFGGVVPVVDAGAVDAPPPLDAPLDDAGPGIDAGPGLDAPIVGIDAGPGMDAGPETDAGPPPVDAPPPTPDTPPEVDAPPDIDAPPDLDAP